MAVNSEERELVNKPIKKPRRATQPEHESAHSSALSASAAASASTVTATTNPFHFWFYFTLLVSIITLFFVYLPSFSQQDPKTWFLNLPLNLRQHYSKGRIFKVQIAPNLPQVEVFTIQEGSLKSDHQVLIVPGFGCSSFAFSGVVKSLGLKGVHAIAVDLPGTGFSDKSMIVVEETLGHNGGFGKLWEVYTEIKVKGIFWAFDQLIEKGYVDYEENNGVVLKREVARPIELGPEEMGRVLGQTIDTMGLAPVDLVLHDSALGLSANWISENPGLVRSVVILDSTSSRTAFPLWALQVPFVWEASLGTGLAFQKLLEFCCFKSVNKLEAEAHRVLLKGRDGRRAVVGMGKKLNYTFDLVQWGSLDAVKGLPLQVIWSEISSNNWKEEGGRVAQAIPQASFVSHSGGLWPQEQNAEEIAESIHKFVASLPKSARQEEEEQEAIPEHIKSILDDAGSTDDQHHHHHHHHHHHSHDGHSHSHSHPGYMDSYGLGNGLAM